MCDATSGLFEVPVVVYGEDSGVTFVVISNKFVTHDFFFPSTWRTSVRLYHLMNIVHMSVLF